MLLSFFVALHCTAAAVLYMHLKKVFTPLKERAGPDGLTNDLGY